MEQYNRCMGCMEEKAEAPTCPVCGWVAGNAPESALHLTPGTLLNNKYLIGKALGQGGFGITYLAWDINLNLKLAIKEYLPQELAYRSGGQSEVSIYKKTLAGHFYYGLEKFLQEARTLARFVEHPNIVSVRDYFKANGTAYLVMNHIEGITLKEYLESKTEPLTFTQALDIFMPVLDALKEVHALDILHRDISPDNLLVNSRGRVILIDFGAARLELQQKSRSLSVIMKAGYSPEEQYRTRGEQGPWTDIYAAAATIYRAVTGQMPPESLDRLAEDILEPPSTLGVEINSHQEEVLLKALAVRSRDRYRSIEELQEALMREAEPAAAITEEEALETVSAVLDAVEPAAAEITPVQAKKTFWKKNSTILQAIGFVVLLALAAFGFDLAKEQFPIFKATHDESNILVVEAQKMQASTVTFNSGAPIVCYAEDFEDVKLSDWDIWIDMPTSDNPGWSIRSESNNNIMEGRGHAFARPHVLGWYNYTVTFRYNLLEQGFQFNIREKSNPGHTRYIVAIDRNGIGLVKQNTQYHSMLSDRDFKLLKRVSRSISLNRWYMLKVSVKDKNIKVYLDDTLVIDYLDNDNPYLDGGFSFETLDYCRVFIDDIVVTQDTLVRVEALIPEPVSVPAYKLSLLALRFFEANEKGADLNRRIYDRSFSGKGSRFIWWELYFSCEPGRKTGLDLFAEYYDPSGELIYAGAVDGMFIDNDWSESLHAAGFGYTVPGLWSPGTYKIKLYLDDHLIVEEDFQIYFDTET